MAKRRSKRRWVLLLGLPLLVVVLLIGLLPTFISMGLGHGRVVAAMQPYVNGRIDFASLRVRWFGPQEMHELRIHDESGKLVAQFDLDTNLSLFGFIFGRIDAIELNLTNGLLDGTLHADGSVSFQKVVKTNPKSPTAKPAGPVVIDLSGLPQMRVNVDVRSANLRDEASGRELVMRDATAALRYASDGVVTFTFDCHTEAEGLHGNVKLSVVGDQLLDHRGRFDPDQGSLTLELVATSLPILGLDERGELQRMRVDVKSARLTDQFVIELDVDAQIEGMEPSRLEGRMTLASVFRADGQIDFRPENLAGSLAGTLVPSSIVQPFLAGTPIVLARDAGPTLGVNVDFVSRDRQDGSGQKLVAAIRAAGSQHNARLDIDASFNLESGEWQGRRLVIASDQAHPDLVEGYTGLQPETPTDVRIELTSFTVPAIDEARGARPLPEFSATGSVSVTGPLRLKLESDPDGPRTLLIEQARIELDSPRLGDHLTVRGSANVEGGEVLFDERITRLFDDVGDIDPFSAKPVGTLHVRNLPRTVLADRLPEYDELLTEFLDERVNVELVTQLAGDELQADLRVVSGDTTMYATALHQPDQLRLTEATADLRITPALAAILQRDREQPIELLAPVIVSAALEPLTLRMTEPFVPSLPDASAGPVSIRLRSPHIAAGGIEALAEPIALRDIVAQLDILISDVWTYDAAITAIVQRHEDNVHVARLDGAAHIEPGEHVGYRGNIAMNDINVAQLEALLGRQHDSLASYLGTDGSVTLELAGRGADATGTITSDMQRVAGRFDLALNDDVLSITTDRANVSVHPVVAERMIHLDPESTTLRVEGDLPLQLRLDTLRLPRSLFFGEAEDGRNPLRDAALDLRLTGGPARLLHQPATRVAVQDIRLHVASAALRDGVTFDLRGLAVHDTGAPGALALTGSLRNLFSPNGEMDLAHAKLDLDADVSRAPTMLIDALLGMNGYLHAVIGPELNARLITRDFSTNSGEAMLDATTIRGFLRGRGTARDGLLHVSEDAPIEGQLDLNPLMRQLLLSQLNPLLGDVVSTEEPLRATLARAALPITGDVSRLNGNVEINIGRVQFDSASQMLSMLAVARGSTARRLDGSIDPIRVRVRNGVVEYDRFNVNIGQIALPYSGRIDLNTGHVELRTTAKLAALANAFLPGGVTAALGGRGADIIRELDVPIVYSGRIGELTPRIDPTFKLEERVARIVLESLLRDQVPKLPIPDPGRFFEDLFPPRRP